MTGDRPLVLGLGGSLRPGSGSLIALRFALACAERSGADTKLLSAAELDLPFYDDRADPSTYPDGVGLLLAAVRRSDALILASPVYHGTMSGSVKNTLDFFELLAADDPPWLEGKIVGFITVSGGRPRSDAAVSLEIACRALHAWTVPIPVSISEAAFEQEELRDPAIEARIQRLVRSLVTATSMHQPGLPPGEPQPLP